MIYTVTFNPSLDYIARTSRLEAGCINRTHDEQILAGGKGINVSIVLNNLGQSTQALGFVAGFTGQEIIRQLDNFGVSENFIRLAEGLSRINVKVKGQEEETEINGAGPNIPPEALDQLYQQLDTLTNKDTLILAGSIPSSLPADTYQQIMARLAPKGVSIIVDATQRLLTNVLPYKPFLIKPNNHELSELFGEELSTRDQLVKAAHKLQEDGAQHILISRASQGAILVGADGAVFEAPAPKGKLINSVGAGDSMVAGFLTGLAKSKGSLEEALYWGIAAGSASAFSYNLATAKEVEALLLQVHK